MRAWNFAIHRVQGDFTMCRCCCHQCSWNRWSLAMRRRGYHNFQWRAVCDAVRHRIPSQRSSCDMHEWNLATCHMPGKSTGSNSSRFRSTLLSHWPGPPLAADCTCDCNFHVLQPAQVSKEASREANQAEGDARTSADAISASFCHDAYVRPGAAHGPSAAACEHIF